MSIEKLKLLLGITGTDQDAILQFIIDNVTETIFNYCNVDLMPVGLINTAYRMAIDLYRNENIGNEAAGKGLVSNETAGKVSIGYQENTAFTQSMLKNYQVQLSRYRKVKWS